MTSPKSNDSRITTTQGGEITTDLGQTEPQIMVWDTPPPQQSEQPVFSLDKTKHRKIRKGLASIVQRVPKQEEYIGSDTRLELYPNRSYAKLELDFKMAGSPDMLATLFTDFSVHHLKHHFAYEEIQASKNRYRIGQYPVEDRDVKTEITIDAFGKRLINALASGPYISNVNILSQGPMTYVTKYILNAIKILQLDPEQMARVQFLNALPKIFDRSLGTLVFADIDHDTNTGQMELEVEFSKRVYDLGGLFALPRHLSQMEGYRDRYADHLFLGRALNPRWDPIPGVSSQLNPVEIDGDLVVGYVSEIEKEKSGGLELEVQIYYPLYGYPYTPQPRANSIARFRNCSIAPWMPPDEATWTERMFKGIDEFDPEEVFEVIPEYAYGDWMPKTGLFRDPVKQIKKKKLRKLPPNYRLACVRMYAKGDMEKIHAAVNRISSWANNDHMQIKQVAATTSLSTKELYDHNQTHNKQNQITG